MLLAISSVKPLARAAVHSPLFIGAPHTPVAASALEVENASVLGALLLPSSMPPPALPGVRGGVGGLDASPLALLVTPAPLLTGAGALSAWPNVTRATFMRAMDDTTSSLAAVHRHAVDAVFSILRADATSVSGVHRPNQRAICAWLLRVLRANAARAQEVPRRAISSDAFFLNYGWLLFDLALPIMSTPGVALHSLTCFQQEAAQLTPPASPPLLAAASSTASVSTGGGGDRIAALQVADALLALRRLMASSTLTLEADNPDAVALLDMKFATQVFAYACMALDWGIVRAAGVMSREQRYLAHVGSSAEGGTDMLRSLQGNRIACNLHRQHPHMLATALHFIVCVCEVMGRAYSMLTRGAFPFAPPASDTGSASPPLPTLDTAPASDARLLFPADFITSLAKAVEFIASARSPLDGRPVVRAAHLSDALAASAPGIVHTFVGLLGAPADVLPSPHARAAMGDALYALLLFAGPSERDEGGDDDSSAPTIDRDDAVASVMWPAVAAAAAPACAMHLVPTLMQLYGDVEGTGFYDKTMHRMRVTGLLNALWQERAHAPAFSAGDTSRLVGFANGVIAHATGLLHTALTGLTSVRAALRLQTDTGAWAALSDAAREEATRTVTDTGNEVRGSMSLVNESMALLDSLTRDPGMCLLFTRDELVDRFATFLMRNLLMLLGPKGTQLKLDNPGAYHFHSRRLLLQLTKCVLRMSALPRFMRAAAECEVYTPSLCAQAVRIVRRIALLPAEGGVLSLRAFEDFMTRVLDMASAAQDEALIAQDAPAEYQDFMGLMKVCGTHARVSSSSMSASREACA
ncbi:MAG: hypothetical protein EOO41_00690 [Methanobacteriota archaeon]|nr:MAG: hypothetical protein EOO41_00690 [Euryarchaeota archaeon]